MPEPSDSDRRKAAQLSPKVASTRLIACVEAGHDLWFKCQYCGMERTWGRREMLSRRLRKHLGWTIDRVQRAATCPMKGCGGPMPIIRLMKGGYQDGFDRSDARRRRAWLVETLLDAGIMPEEAGLTSSARG
ncbi:hypothetical protein [Caulobacter sp. LARHSG274]